MIKVTILLSTALFTAVWPILALAHVGTDTSAHHSAGVLQGLWHPLSGADHWLAMLMVGFWSGATQRRFWVIPVVFAVLFLVGAALGFAGLSLPLVEPIIAASVLFLGVLVALHKRWPLTLAAPLIGGFALCHGLAHGNEFNISAAPWLALTGMLVTTLLLHATGLFVAKIARAQRYEWSRAIGASAALLGSYLLIQSI